MDIRQRGVEPTSRMHLRDANDELMYLRTESGEDDVSKPIAVVLYGPGSKQHARATTANSNRMMARLKAKGKSDQTEEERRQENAEFLASCTHSWENMIFLSDGPNPQPLEGRDLSMAVYSELSIGYIADQVAKFIGEWSNFSKPSTKS